MLACLIFAIVALLASFATALPIPSCKDDPSFVYKKPKKDGTIRNCEWIESLPKGKRNKICKRRKNSEEEPFLRIRNSCPVACGYCGGFKTECPRKFYDPDSGKKRSEGGDCSRYMPGLECETNFEYFGGCGEEDPITCVAKDIFTCGKDATWIKSSFERFPCVGDVFPPSGETCDPALCPLNAPDNGSECFDQQVGTDCDYDYTVVGCTFEDATCSATRFFTCMEDRTWIMAVPELDVRFCEDPPDPPIGDSCDPKEFCPLRKPHPETRCGEDQAGLICEFDYKYFGCHFTDGFSCGPTSTYRCLENQEWEVAELIVEPCPDPSQGSVQYQTCKPCPRVEPEGICPPEVPKPDTECFIDHEGSCKYDFSITGCSASELQCSPGRQFFCSNGRWEELISLPNLPCEPTGKLCPEEKPKDNLCRMHGYDPGLSCAYDYMDSSCDLTSESCVPITNYYCTENEGWMIAMASFMCEGDAYPPDFLHTCDREDPYLCPLVEPQPNTKCTDIGIACEFDHMYFGCTLEKATCSAGSIYTCADDGIWRLMIRDPLFCEDRVPPLGESCDPQGCPLAAPDFQSSCSIGQFGITCPYYEYVGCNYQDGFRCEATTSATCGERLEWQVVQMESVCIDEDPDSVRGMPCEPCPEVESADICPSVKPKPRTFCENEGADCKYDFVVSGCSADALQCMFLSFFTCIEGSWVEGIADPKPCLPDRLDDPEN